MSTSFMLIAVPLMAVFGLVLPGALVWSAIANHEDGADTTAFFIGAAWFAAGMVVLTKIVLG